MPSLRGINRAVSWLTGDGASGLAATARSRLSDVSDRVRATGRSVLDNQSLNIPIGRTPGRAGSPIPPPPSRTGPSPTWAGSRYNPGTGRWHGTHSPQMVPTPVHGPINISPMQGPPIPRYMNQQGWTLNEPPGRANLLGGIGNMVTKHPLALMGLGVAAVTIPGAAEGMFNMAELAAFGRDDIDQAVLGQDIGLSAMYPLPSALRMPPGWDLWQYRNSPVAIEGAFARDPMFDTATSQDWYAALDTIDSERPSGRLRPGASDYARNYNWQSSYPYRPSTVRRGAAADGSMVMGMWNLR